MSQKRMCGRSAVALHEGLPSRAGLQPCLLSKWLLF